MVNPPIGAGEASVTVPLTIAPQVTELALRFIEARLRGWMVNVAVDEE
jgi:hypothetical protein